MQSWLRCAAPSYLPAALLLIPASILFHGCSDDPGVPTGTPEVANQISLIEPDPNEDYVQLDSEIWITYTQEVSVERVQATSFTVNGEAATVTLSGTSNRKVTLEPATPLQYHTIYEVEIASPNGGGLPDYSWQFATEPGPAGVLWKRIPAPGTADLFSVSTEDGWYYYAVGEGGANYRGRLALDWEMNPRGVGTDGTPTTKDLIRLELLPSSHITILEKDGDLLWSWWSFGTSMGRTELPPDVLLHDFVLSTNLMVGTRISDPQMGVILNHEMNLFETGSGRVMNAAHKGYDNGDYWLAAGTNGSIFYSRNRETWQDVANQPAWGDFHGIWGSFPNNSRRAVAVGERIAYSENGLSWTMAEFVPPATLRDVWYARYPEPMYVAIGDNGTVLRSTDAINWSAWDIGIPVTEDLNDMVLDPRRFVIVGDDGTLLVSPPRYIDL